MADLLSQLRALMLSPDTVNSLEFNAWNKDQQELVQCARQMFEETGVLRDLDISLDHLLQFISATKNSYNENPFHNFWHAVTVAQMAYLFITKTELAERLHPKEKFAVIVAALCHDLDHPGLSNGYQINSKSPLAVMYNNQSVLENHHLATCLKLLKSADDSRAPVTGSESDEEKTELRQWLTRMILGTDLARHFDLKKQFDEISSNFSWNEKAHREILLVMLIKAADISNEVRPFMISERWANALMQEFFAQSDLEKARNLPVTPFMEREKVVLSRTQVGFIDTFLLPTFTSLNKIVVGMAPFLESVTQNRQKWSELVEQQTTTN